MPILSNARHERFAQELAKGKSAVEAYELAGYSPNPGNCIRLKGNESVAARISEILGRGAERAEVTVTSLMAELDEARDLARTIEQPAAMIAATREKGILSGKRVERREIGEPGEFDRMSDEELTEWLHDQEAVMVLPVEGSQTEH